MQRIKVEKGGNTHIEEGIVESKEDCRNMGSRKIMTREVKLVSHYYRDLMRGMRREIMLALWRCVGVKVESQGHTVQGRGEGDS